MSFLMQILSNYLEQGSTISEYQDDKEVFKVSVLNFRNQKY